MRDFVVKFTSVPEQKIVAFKDLDPTLTSHVDANEFKNVMALIDTRGEKTLYGAEGVAYIFTSQYQIAELFFKLPLAFTVFNFFYKTQAYNRYIMVTPKSKFECDCFPDSVVKYRISYIAITIFISVVLTALFGISLRNFFENLSSSQAAFQMLVMAGSGWCLQALLALIFFRRQALDYMGHLGSIMVAGLLILVPWMVFQTLTGISSIYFPLLSVLLSSAYMLYLHIGRMRYLKLSQRWTASWFLLLQGTASFWIYWFYLK